MAVEDTAPDVDGSDIAPLIVTVLDLHQAAGRDRFSALRDVLGVGPETDKAWGERLHRSATELQGASTRWRAGKGT
jgi:hypothetical protein